MRFEAPSIPSLRAKASPTIAVSPGAVGFLWGGLVGLTPLFDFLGRPPRQELAEYSFTLVRDTPPTLAAVLGALLLANGLPAALAAWRCGIDFRRAGLFPTIAFVNVLAISISLIEAGGIALVYIVLVAYCFALATILSALSSHGREFMVGFLRAVALGIAAAILVMIADGNVSFGRLMGRSGPNYWGMNALVVFFCAFAFRSHLCKAALAVVAVAAIYLCQSRGALMALCVGTGVLWLAVAYHASPAKRLALVGLTAFFGSVALVLLSDTIATKLLLVDNPGRGLSSGGTGRFAAWVQTFDLFANSPWFGVGYRQHERLITAASSSHNAYLASLADTGSIGFSAYLALMFGGTAVAVAKAFREPDGVRFAVAGLAVSFLVVGLVERVAINTGNALSLTMIFSVAFTFRASDREKRLACPPTRAPQWSRAEPPGRAAL